MGIFWQKPLFWIIVFVVLTAAIPLLFFYLKHTILPNPSSSPTSKSSEETQPAVATKPGSCLILEEKYCTQAKLIKRQTAPGSTVKMIGFRLPPEVPIFLPSDGQVAKTKLDNNVVFYKGYQAIMFNPNSPNTLRYKFSGDLHFDDMLSSNLMNGDIIGYTQDTGIDMLGYNLIFYPYNIGSDRQEIINEEEIKRMLPAVKL